MFFASWLHFVVKEMFGNTDMEIAFVSFQGLPHLLTLHVPLYSQGITQVVLYTKNTNNIRRRKILTCIQYKRRSSVKGERKMWKQATAWIYTHTHTQIYASLYVPKIFSHLSFTIKVKQNSYFSLFSSPAQLKTN